LKLVYQTDYIPIGTINRNFFRSFELQYYIPQIMIINSSHFHSALDLHNSIEEFDLGVTNWLVVGIVASFKSLNKLSNSRLQQITV
jgi:hypothetical protein